jgi:hypothetical protein
VEANALEEKKALANGFRDDGIFTDEIHLNEGVANDIVAETTGVPIRNVRRWTRRDVSKK